MEKYVISKGDDIETDKYLSKHLGLNIRRDLLRNSALTPRS